MIKKVVVLGGGTGSFAVLSGIKNYRLEITSIVSTADDGGSTGQLRDELGVLPPGDIRQALVALSNDQTTLRQLFNYRFMAGSLKGHNFGNLFLSALEKITGSFDTAVMEAGKILNIKGGVVPVTNDQAYLRAKSLDGEVIMGEHNIEEHIWAEKGHLKKLWLEPKCHIHPIAALAIKKADLIVIAPGSIFTSLIPNLLVSGVVEAIQNSKAKLVYVANLMTEKGQTTDFFVQDFADLIEQYLGKDQIDYVIYNTGKIDALRLASYKKEMERQPVVIDKTRKNNYYKLVGANLISTFGRRDVADKLASTRSLIRHNPVKLAEVIFALSNVKELEKYLKYA